MTAKSSKHPKRVRNGNVRTTSRQSYTVGSFFFVFLMVMLLSAAIVFMLVQTTIVHRSDWLDKKVNALRDSLEIRAPRGDIYACDGSILATNMQYYEISIDFRSPRFRVIEYDSLKYELAGALARDFADRRDSLGWLRYLDAPLQKPRNKRISGYPLLRNLTWEQVLRVRSYPFFNLARKSESIRSSATTGFVVQPMECRVYPYGDMAKLSIGRTGSINGSRSLHGISGLERALDSLLFGVPGVKRKRMMTKYEGYWVDRPAVRGCDVYSTIDITMQDILEQELSAIVLNSGAQWGTAILMETSTGDIKAISNVEPDPNRPGHVIEAMNRAVLGYEPGSVVKIMTMAVALNEGFADPNKVYEIGHSRVVQGRVVRDTHSPGTLPLQRFIEYSSNIGMARLTMEHYRDCPEQFREDLAKLGFFDRFNTGIARETTPWYPRLTHDSRGAFNLVGMSFGYATMIPPLYTCAFYNAIANGGRFVRPRIARGLRLPDGRDSIIPVSYVREQMLSPENNEILRRMIHEVVWGEGGTAKKLRNDTVEIAGKTGTAKIARERPDSVVGPDGRKYQPPFVGGYIEGHYRMAFCGFFPYENPQFTCIVVIQDPRGQYASPASSSGRVLKNVALRLYARGMLNNYTELKEPASAPSDATPMLYASQRRDLPQIFRSAFGITSNDRMLQPSTGACGTVPDVSGLGVREAVVILEEAGYNVNFSGAGYVVQQHPAAGSHAPADTIVTLTLKQF